MKIYFTGSVRGGRANQPKYKSILNELCKYGEVLSDNVGKDDLTSYGETEFLSQEILEREKEMIRKCDVVVADVSVPSLGVGYLISLATSQNKKVFGLYRGFNLHKLSAIIRGDELVKIYEYEGDEEIVEILEEIFTNKNNFK